MGKYSKKSKVQLLDDGSESESGAPSDNFPIDAKEAVVNDFRNSDFLQAIMQQMVAVQQQAKWEGDATISQLRLEIMQLRKDLDRKSGEAERSTSMPESTSSQCHPTSSYEQQRVLSVHSAATVGSSGCQRPRSHGSSGTSVSQARQFAPLDTLNDEMASPSEGTITTSALPIGSPKGQEKEHLSNSEILETRVDHESSGSLRNSKHVQEETSSKSSPGAAALPAGLASGSLPVASAVPNIALVSPSDFPVELEKLDPTATGEGSGEPQEESKKITNLMGWLSDQGANVEGVECRPDGNGSLALFATKPFCPGDSLAMIPMTAILTVAKARSHSLGALAIAAGAPESLAMWMSMAEGRENHDHPWHPYLAFLPTEQPDPLGWPDEALAALKGTPVFDSVKTVREDIRSEFQKLVKNKEFPNDRNVDFSRMLSLERIFWARGMHLSRCISPESEKGINHGLKKESIIIHEVYMIPLLDIIGSKTGCPVGLEFQPSGVTLKALEQISIGDQLCRSWGRGRSNEETLFTCGTAEAQPTVPCDVVSSLVISWEEDDRALLKTKYNRLRQENVPCLTKEPLRKTLDLGPFCIGPFSVESILPAVLLRGLEILAIEEVDEEPEMSLDVLNGLRGTLASRLAQSRLAPAPPATPAHRAASIKAYCSGRCRVLEAALSEVEDMLKRGEAEVAAAEAAEARKRKPAGAKTSKSRTKGRK